MATQTEGPRIDDVVKWMVNRDYCVELVTLDTSVAVDVGTVLDISTPTASVLITNGNEADTGAIALEKRTATDARTLLPVLVRGPAIVDGDKLLLETSVTIAEVTTPLVALGVLVHREPTLQQTL